MPDLLTEALSRLPHGSEFRFIDNLISLQPGKTGAGNYHVRGDEHFLKGHFPGEALFPGVLLLEGMAQIAGVVAQSDPLIAPLPGLKLTALRGAKIIGTARPGETIRFEATILGRMGNLIQAQTSAWVGDKNMAQAELTLSGSR